jgi:twitching motility protein PilJ
MRMLSQRLAKASTLALQGNPAAFAQLKDSRETFGRLLERLTSGGDIAGTDVPASPAAVPQLEALTRIWAETDKDAMTVIGQEANLVALGKSVTTIDNENPVMLELAEQVAALKLQPAAARGRSRQPTSWSC